MSDSITQVPTGNLHFDPDNPRFYRLGRGDLSEYSIIEEMVDNEGLFDLMRSIGEQGYFQGEPLLVAEEEGRYVVIEGNRRLAAVKLLKGEIQAPPRRTQSVRQLIDEAKTLPGDSLPCIIYSSRQDVLRYLGYRHITGIKQWDSLSKARYLASVRDTFYSRLPIPEQMKSLANDIGSRSDYVAQLLAAFNLYDTAENSSFFGLRISQNDVEFSYLTTALNYTNITDWLGLESRKDTVQSGLNQEHLKELFAWMFVQDQQGRTILGESRNLKELAAVIGSESGIASLRKDGDLSTAFLFSEGPLEALSNALENAIKHTRTAWELLLETPEITAAHEGLVDELFENIRNIRNHIRFKREE
jgi:hypothetical protein